MDSSNAVPGEALEWLLSRMVLFFDYFNALTDL